MIISGIKITFMDVMSRVPIYNVICYKIIRKLNQTLVDDLVSFFKIDFVSVGNA